MRISPGFVLAVLLAACGESAPPPAADADADGFTAPTPATVAANARVRDALPFGDVQDFEDARRGLVASDPSLVVNNAAGAPIWDMPAYAFLDGAAPDSVNPSLWRHAQLNAIHGLFKVADGIYQLRGYDISNMTLIEGQTGWIVVDPLTARETAARAMAFARQHLGEKPVRAVIFTHSHVDHFGGVLGLLDAAQSGAGGVRIVAPAGFTEEATSENVLVGTAMSRRSMYQFGKNLPRSARAHLDSGVGKTAAYGTVGVLPPTDIVERTGQELTLDGVRFVFQHVPGSEAPAELNFYLPAQKAFCAAEIVTRTLHNLYTLRGAKVRDALRWAGYVDEMITRFGEAEIHFSSHNWPMWGRERVREFWEVHRDTYKFIHDQTVRLARSGATPKEIAETLVLPASLGSTFANRGYYGTLRHNAKAVYQFYLGWYDANPANLDPLPPADAGTRYVALMGGADEVLKKGQAAFDAGEYRWAAELLNHLVFAEPGNGAARALLARCYDQLGYQAESAIWRDAYLTGAYELRHGAPAQGIDVGATFDMLLHTPVPRFLDAMAASLKAEDAEGVDLTVNLVFSDLGESYALRVKNSVLHHRAGADPAADATLTLTHALYLKMLIGQAGIKDTLLSDDLKVSGSRLDLARFFGLFEKPATAFNIVTP